MIGKNDYLLTMLKKKLLVVNKIKGFITKGSICYSESIITDCTFTKMIITRPCCIVASVTHKPFTMSHLQDIKVTVAVRDCGMCGENKAPRTTEKAPELKTKRPSTTC